MQHHDLLHDRQAKTGALGTRGEERLEDALTGSLWDARPVVFNRHAAAVVGDIHPPVNPDVGRHTGPLARVRRIPYEIAEYLAQQHFVAENLGEVPVDVERGPGWQLVAQVVRGASSDDAEVHARQGDVFRTRKAEEVGHHLAERLGLLTDALDVWLVLRRHGFDLDQSAIAMNRREAVAELVREAGGQLTEARQRLFQAQLLFQLHDRRQIREEANHAGSRVSSTLDSLCRRSGRLSFVQVRLQLPQRRHGHAEMNRPAALDLHRSSKDRTRGCQTLFNQLHEWRKRQQHRVVVGANRIALHVNHRAPGPVEDLHAPTSMDYKQPRRQALDDVAAQLL